MPGFTYHFDTFDSDTHLVSAIFVNDNYLTLRIKDNFNLEAAFGYEKLLEFKGFKLIPFYNKDDNHISDHAKIHPAPDSYFDVFGWIFGMRSSFLKDHYHFKCADKKGNNLEITPPRLKEILVQLKNFQNDIHLREHMKEYFLTRRSREQAPEHEMLQLKRINTHIKIFPDKELGKLTKLFLDSYCQPVSTSLLSQNQIAVLEEKSKICPYSDLSPPPTSAPKLLAQNSSYELAGSYAYSIVAVAAGLFCLRKCLKKPNKSKAESAEKPPALSR